MTETMDEQARRLLRPLAGEPARPSGVDVPRAMAEGRRRRRVRWLATGTAVAALTGTSVAGGTLAVSAIDGPPEVPVPHVVQSPAPAGGVGASAVPTSVAVAALGPAGCTVTRLPTDGVAQAVVTGGDPSGRLLAGRLYRSSDRNFHRGLVIWRDGRIAAQFRLPGGDGGIRDLNTDGVGVGASFPGGNDPVPYAYADGEVIKLRGGTGMATAINDSGVIVGQIGTVAARWPSVTTAPQELSVPAGTSDSMAIDIDRDGRILGTVRTKRTVEPTGYLWAPDGTGDYLPLPVMDGVRATFFWPESINNGWITGRGGISDDVSTRFVWFRYRIATRTYERLPDDAGMPARVAANGWVLGAGATPTITVGRRVTALPGYRNEKEYQLTAFSDDGLVAAGHSTTLDEGAENQPLLWRCRLPR